MALITGGSTGLGAEFARQLAARGRSLVLVALSEELALTLKDTGVNVSALCPGYTHTVFHATAGQQAKKDALPSWLWYDAAVVVKEGLSTKFGRGSKFGFRFPS